VHPGSRGGSQVKGNTVRLGMVQGKPDTLSGIHVILPKKYAAGI
jgi:hypothetical protein